MEKPIIDKILKVQKYPGKGGWTYVVIETATPDVKNPFGWRKVKGSVDNYPVNQYKLMPMGNGQLFLPLKAEMRKKIGKKEGDSVHVILFDDNSVIVVPDEIQACLEDVPAAKTFFESLSESNQKYYLDWVLRAKTMETTVKRVNTMIERLLQRKKMYDS